MPAYRPFTYPTPVRHLSSRIFLFGLMRSHHSSLLGYCLAFSTCSVVPLQRLSPFPHILYMNPCTSCLRCTGTGNPIKFFPGFHPSGADIPGYRSRPGLVPMMAGTRRPCSITRYADLTMSVHSRYSCLTFRNQHRDLWKNPD